VHPPPANEPVETTRQEDEAIEGHFPPQFLAIGRRILDIVLSACALVLCSPVMVLIGILIRLDSPGPAIFRQTRIGQCRQFNRWRKRGTGERRKRDLNGEPFSFYKFRTMYIDARERWPELYEYDYTPEEIRTMRFKLIEDPRLTGMGEFLRRYTLDELPNFLNVLIGNMALIGPRPDIPEMMRYYEPWQREKFTVKPGLTGMAQCDGRGLLTFQETLARDVYYVKNQSLKLDLKILLVTIRHLVSRKGAF
jgi:lipopolysaccharide/colanic/teichoic acid biosynthesis glycosyltransferase